MGRIVAYMGILLLVSASFLEVLSADEGSETPPLLSKDTNPEQSFSEEPAEQSQISREADTKHDEDSSVTASDEQDLPTFSSDVTEHMPAKVIDNADDALSQTTKAMGESIELSSSSNDTASQEALNNSMTNSTGSGEKSTNGTVTCAPRELLENEIPVVKIVNGTTLLKELTPASNDSEGRCTIVLFYFPWCMFSARAAPHFNALARVFPQIACFAIDADSRNNLNMRYGLVAVPTVLLFHNGRVIAKFNDSVPSLEKFVSFIAKYTGLTPASPENVTITSADMQGPVPTTPVPKTDYILILSWAFCLIFFSFAFLRSSLCNRIVECVRNTWKEAEAQHEHEE